MGELVLGVDAGGSKTDALIATLDGRIVGAGRAGPANFQGVGVRAAREEVARAIGMAGNGVALDRGPERSGDPDRAGGPDRACDAGRFSVAWFGMAGADRPKDFDTVRELLDGVVSAGLTVVDNDSVAALYAGEPTGVGVCAICGSGTNVVGINAAGERVQVGGLGDLLGDRAGGSWLAREAIRAAARALDGRGRPTRLQEKVRHACGVADLTDLVEYWYFDKRDALSLDVSRVPPLVFQAAEEGDEVAKGLLLGMADELALGVWVALSRLFEPGESVTCVLAGGVLVKPRSAILRAAVRDQILRRWPSAEVRVLDPGIPPAAGSVVAALRLAGRSISSEQLWGDSL